MDQRISLLVKREHGAPCERRVVFATEVVRIGSHPSNDIVLDDPEVSAFHCEVRSNRSGWRIVDPGSEGGTRVGGITVRDADLSALCTIELGQSAILVQNQASLDAPVTESFGAIVGASEKLQRLCSRIARLAKVDGDVLIQGESGTGKELIAEELRRRSQRADKPFVVVDCSALARSLAESELFGHVRGAFTSAEQSRMGAFESAQGGTLFLDEIGELPLDLQPMLLRALAARQIRRMGSNESIDIDVRVIAATNRRLEDELQAGRFRDDLYFRLGVLRIDVPPLRDRIDDVPMLVASFLERRGALHRLESFTPEIMGELLAYDWPGNVRELKNFVERFVVFDERETLTPTPARGFVLKGITSAPLPAFRVAKEKTIEDFEKSYLKALIVESQGNVSRAARHADLDRMHLHRLLQKHGIRKGA